MRQSNKSEMEILSILQAADRERKEMTDVKVAKDFYIPKCNIKFYTGYTSNFVKNDVRAKRKEKKVFDYTCGKKTLSVIYLTSGEVILTNTSVETLNLRMNHNEESKDNSRKG